jgi:hypothetical protein
VVSCDLAYAAEDAQFGLSEVNFGILPAGNIPRAYDLGLYRKRIESVNSQLESMGVEHLKARTHAGLEIKLHASLLAVFCTNADLN